MTWRPEVLEHLGRPESASKARAALWRVGDLGWALHADQHAARATVAAAERRGVRRTVCMCGRRWGKTRFFVVDALEYGMQHGGARMPYAALTWKSATGFVFPEVEALSAYAPADVRPAIVDGEVRFANGSKILVSGCEDERKADRLRGPSAHRAYIDEAGFIDILDYVLRSVLAQQLLTTDGAMLVASSPPLTPVHPFVELVGDAQARGALVRRKTSDAPHVSHEALARLCEEMGGAQSTEYRRECECEIITDESRAVLPEWSAHAPAVVPRVGHDGKPLWWPEAEHRHWFVAADLGYIDLTVVLLGWWDFLGHRLVVEDERVLVRPTSGDVQRAAAEMEASHGARPKTRVADAPPIVVADMARLQPHEAEPARWKVTKKDDREGAINALRLMVARHELVIHPRCTTTIAHCEFAIWNKMRSDFDRSDKEGLGHFDALAALVYLARSVQRTNPYPGKPPPSHMAGLSVPAHIAHPPSPGKLPSRWTRR